MKFQFFRVSDAGTVTISHFFVDAGNRPFAKVDVETARVHFYGGSGTWVSMPRAVADEIRADGPDAEAKAESWIRHRFPSSVAAAEAS